MLQLASIICGLVSLFAWTFLWLLAAASHTDVQHQFPAYAEAVFRTRQQGMLRNGGPVRAWSLLTVAPPMGGYRPIVQMRVLAAVLFGSAIATGILWGAA